MSTPSPRLDAYLAELHRALALYPGRRAAVMAEVRDHLLEARERELATGVAPDEAEERALQAFGDPAEIARGLVAQRSRARMLRLLPLAFALGLAVAWVDSRPTWDDTGVTAFTVLALSGLFGLFEPKHPSLWALAVGAWIPLLAVVQHGSHATALALVFAFAGAYGAQLVRRIAAA